MIRIKPVILLFAGIVLFAACSKSDDTKPANPTIQIAASFNNVAWNTDLAGGLIIYDTTNNIEMLTVGGGYKLPLPDTVYQGISITIDSFQGLKTYPITKNGPCKAWFLHGTKQFLAKSGSINVRSYSNKLVTGEFDFVTDTVTVSGGTYNLHVQ